MSALYLVLPLALLVAGCAVAAFIWTVRSGQLDDVDTPPRRMLFEDVPVATPEAAGATVARPPRDTQESRAILDGRPRTRGTSRANPSDRSPHMTIPLDLTFRDMEPSDAVAARIREQLDRLTHAHGRIHRCVAVVEHPHHSQRHGQTFHVRLELSVPERMIEVSRDPERDPTHANVYAAIDDAFRVARRQLQAHAEIQRGDVKTHA